MEPARGDEKREAPVTLSAAEEAYLRRFVRRHALSGVVGRGLVVGVLIALGLALWPLGRQPSASPQPSSAQGARALAAELETIRSEVAAQPARDATDAATRAAVAELARRIEAIAREIGALRSRPAVAPAAPPAQAPAPGGAGVAALSERLHDLETRQQSREHENASALRLLVGRVEQLERSRDVTEAQRLSGQGEILARLAALEARSEVLPAAPEP